MEPSSKRCQIKRSEIQPSSGIDKPGPFVSQSCRTAHGNVNMVIAHPLFPLSHNVCGSLICSDVGATDNVLGCHPDRLPVNSSLASNETSVLLHKRQSQ